MSPLTSTRLDETNDTEITLGTGKMLLLFFGLVALCAVFFAMGFSMGKNSLRSAPELLPSPGSPGQRPSAANKPVAPAASPDTQTAAPPQQASADPASPAGSSSNPVQPPAAQDQSAPASPQPGQAYYVQVAAVSKQEDAEALVEALKSHQYSAFIANQPSDKLFHVQVGPFADIKDAESVRAKLVSDGYSPILKK